MLKIGTIQLNNPFLQAALSGYTEYAMRILARQFGSSLTLTGVMLDRISLHPKAIKQTKFHCFEDEHPVGAQIFGHDPETIAQSAVQFRKMGFDLIDLNFACPVPKVLRRERGGWLMRKPEVVRDAFRRTRDAVDCPVMMKLRIGFDHSEAAKEDFWKIIENAAADGVDALGIHGRTVEQKYKGKADWGVIAEVKKKYPQMTLFGSGDLMDAPTIMQRMRETQTLAVAFLFALPGLLPPLYGEFLSKSTPMTQSASAGEVSRLSVLLANPFHLDPKHFMTGLEHLKVALFEVLALLLMRYHLPAEHARVMTLFILFLLLFFLSGLVARAAEWYQYLKYYPFRVADGFLPLSFWMGAVILFQNAVTRYANKTIVFVLMVPLTIGTANYLIELCEPSPRYELSFSSYAQAMAKTEPRTTAYNVRERGKEWHALFARESRSDIEEMEAWIRKNTPKDSVFINLPWSVSFSLNAQRARTRAFPRRSRSHIRHRDPGASWPASTCFAFIETRPLMRISARA